LLNVSVDNLRHGGYGPGAMLEVTSINLAGISYFPFQFWVPILGSPCSVNVEDSKNVALDIISCHDTTKSSLFII
jgi:hypothetical protein